MAQTKKPSLLPLEPDATVYRLGMRIWRLAQTNLKKPGIQRSLRVIITVAFVVFVNKSLRRSDLVDLLKEVEWLPLLGASVLGVVSILLQVLRWQVILRAHGLPATFVVALRTMLWGFLLAFITPGRIGELLRGVALDEKRRMATIVAVVEDRLFAIACTLCAGAVSMVLLWVLYKASVPQIVFVPTLLLLVGVPVVAAALFTSGKLRGKQLVMGSWIGSARAYGKQLLTLPLGRLSLLSVGIHLILLTQTALLMQMFWGWSLVQNGIIAGQAFSFMLFLPFFIANIGLREYAFTFFMHLAHPEVATLSVSVAALGISTTILIINIIAPAAVGLVWILFERHYGKKGYALQPEVPHATGKTSKQQVAETS